LRGAVMNSLRRVSFNILVALFMMSAAVAGYADDNDDPPSRVARLKYVSGDVSVQPGGVDDWVLASVNRPLTTADRVWTDRDARAELHLGTAVMRMNSETSLGLTYLTDQTVQVAVYQGTLNLRIKSLFRGEIYEVDTPNVAFTITKAGEYRFDVDANNDTTFVIVRKGEGVATGDGPAVKVKKDQYARFSGAKSMDHSIGRSPALDGFDEWCRVRDSRETYYYARRYVSPYTIGYEDLDGYGDWNVVSSYGPVWYPRYVVAGWAPYRYGHWVWINPWGWTWVDDAPWGFAPFHYGRWVSYGGRWGWCPGPIRYRPYYAPALVAWVGGSHFSIGISFGGPRVGWFPLGYGDPYIPYRRVSRNYFQQVNITNTRITNVTNITNIYNNVYVDNRNINIHNNNNNNDHSHHNDNVRIHNNNIRYANYRVRDAVTNVDRDTMVRGKPVHQANLRLDPKNLKDDDVQFRSHVNPGRESVLGGRDDRRAPRPDRIEARQVKEKMTPPQRASVEERRRAIERDINRPDRDAGDRGRGNDRNDRQAIDNRNDRNDRQAGDYNNRVPRPGRGNDGGQNGRGNGNDRQATDNRNAGIDRQANDNNNRVPRSGRGNDDGQNGRGGTDSADRGGKPQRIIPGPADHIPNRGGSEASNDSGRIRDFPTSVPRPRRDAGPTTRMEAKEREQGVPRPDVSIGGGNNGGGSNGRDAREDQSNGPGNSERRRDAERINVPRPPADRGPAMDPQRSGPKDRSDSRPVFSSGNENRGGSPGRVEAPRPEPRMERAPREESHQSRPEMSAPSRPESPRMESPRSQPRPEVSAPRSEPRMESSRPQSMPHSEAPRVERQAPPSSHGNGNGSGGGHQGGGGGGRNGGNGGGKDQGGKDRGGNDRPDGKQ
jgi:Family of unknown function (DUF6600)